VFNINLVGKRAGGLKSLESGETVAGRWSRKALLLAACAALALAGCGKGGDEFNEGKKAEALKDYDTAVIHYQRALQKDPLNAQYQLKVDSLRFDAAQAHVETGQKILAKGDLQMALAEFQKATLIDPSSPIAQQEVQSTMAAIAAKNAAAKAPAAATPPADEPKMMSGPPEIKPLSRAPINLKMTNDSKIIFDTVAKLAGLTVIFDPDFTSRRIATELTDVTVEQALDIVSLEAKAFWKPVTNNIIFIAPDQAQKRRDYEEEIVRTIYLKNTILPQDITEIVNGLRQLLDLRRVQQFNAQNAIIVRDTPDKVMLAEKIVQDIDKPKSEVVIQFAVLQTSRTRMRDLGITPGTSVGLAFSPPCNPATNSSCSTSTSTTTTTSTSTATSLPLNALRQLGTSDYSVTLPSATANALLTDSQTQIIDDPEIRMVDGQEAKLRIGSRVPVATGSFQAGVGVGATGTAGGIVNPLVNTQFQYLDVGVIVDVTPRIHSEDREVSLKLSVEVSSVASFESIGGINQPVISTKRIEHDVRLEDGEVNILGGLIERNNTKSVTGWPGLSDVPFLRYFTSDNNVSNEVEEDLIVVIPHIIRTPNITLENMRSLASGTDTNPEIRLESVVMSPSAEPPSTQTSGGAAGSPLAKPAAPAPGAAVAPPGAASGPAAAAPASLTQGAQLHFDPATVSVKPGESTTIGLAVQDAQDLYSIPLLLQFDPKVISVEDVRQGGFLSGGTQPIAIVQRVDKERGQAIISATRMPNTPGVSGSGTVFGIVVRGVAAGSSTISIIQVNARDSQQRPMQMVSTEATVTVQP
jgi:general secretion pathway protein D